MRHRRVDGTFRTRIRTRFRTRWLAVGLPLALVLGAPARADEEVVEPAPRTRRAVEILDHMDESLVVKPSPLTRLGLSTRDGLTYRHSIMLAGRRFELRLNGPVQKRKTFGLGVKIEF